MLRFVSFCFLLSVHSLRPAAHEVPRRVDAGGVLHRLTVAAFPGATIQALASDAAGNLYVAGTTTSPDLPVKNAAQPTLGNANVLVTTDLGATWKAVHTPPGTDVIAPDPVSAQILFAGGNSGIYKTTDGGETWRQVYGFQPSRLFPFSTSIAIDPANHLRVAALSPSPTSLVRSVDGGETWAPAGAACPMTGCGGGGQLMADPTGSGALLYLPNASLSRDWGLTFHPLIPPAPGSLTAAAFDPSHPGWLYADATAGSSGRLFLTTDYGATWTPRASPGTTFTDVLHMAVAPDEAPVLLATLVDGLYKSTDGGASWTRQPGATPSPFSPLVTVGRECSPTGGLFALLGGGPFTQVASSPDYGATWNTPRLSGAGSIAAGPHCAVYVTRQTGATATDAFAAKLDPQGNMLWATYLGGSDNDAPVAIAVDSAGRVYVTGTTLSPDFPATAPPIGVPNQNSFFVTRYSPEGELDYSVLIGGTGVSSPTALAIDAGQNMFVVGSTSSKDFPVTTGALASTPDTGGSTGFAVKLSDQGDLVAATYLPSSRPVALAIDSNGHPVVAGSGSGGPIMRLDSSLSAVLSSVSLPDQNRPNALAIDGQDNVVLFGGAPATAIQATPGTYVTPELELICTDTNRFFFGIDSFITKLAAADWKPIYTAHLAAPCGMHLGSMILDQSGAPVLAFGTGGGFSLRNALVGGPACSSDSSVIAKLSADGSTLDFATYLDACGAPPFAVALEAAVYAAHNSGAAGVLRIPIPAGAAIDIQQVWNAFSGDPGGIVPGGLYSLAAPGLSLPTNDLGLNAKQDLPLEVGGTRVTFDGAPAPILRTEPGRIIVAAPMNLYDAGRNSHYGFTRCQGKVEMSPSWQSRNVPFCRRT